MKMNHKIEYSEDNDTLYISSINLDEDVAGSIPLGNVVLDIGTSGKLLGIEIDNASEVLGVEPEKILKANEARIGVRTHGNILFVFFWINLLEKTYEFSYAFPKNKIALCA
jgi:uncharacterized protein YuzE